MKSKKIIKILEKVKPYLIDNAGMSELIYRTPQQSLREEADKIDAKDIVIEEFNQLLEELRKESIYDRQNRRI